MSLPLDVPQSWLTNWLDDVDSLLEWTETRLWQMERCWSSHRRAQLIGFDPKWLVFRLDRLRCSKEGLYHDGDLLPNRLDGLRHRLDLFPFRIH